MSYEYLKEDVIAVKLCKEIGRIEEHDVKLTPEDEARAIRLHKESIIIDFHIHSRVLPENMGDRELYARSGRVATGFEGIRRSGMTAFMEGFGGNIARRSSPVNWQFEDMLWDLGMRQCDYDHHKEVVTRGYCVNDILEAKKSGRTAIIPMSENAGMIYNDLDRLDVLYGMGIRCMGLSFNHRSFIADGVLEKHDSGISEFGLKVIRRMNRLGMLIDFSHSSNLSIKQGIEASEFPCCFTHMTVKAVQDNLGMENPKGLTDDNMELIAKHEGLIGLEAVPNITSNKSVQTVFDLIDHVDYAVKRVGVDHVAIGTDTLFGDHVGSHKATKGLPQTFGGGDYVKELKATHIDCIENPSQLPNVTRALVARGYSDADIKKIMGENVLKLFEKTIG